MDVNHVRAGAESGEELDPFGMKLQTVVSHHLGARNQTQDFCKSTECS